MTTADAPPAKTRRFRRWFTSIRAKITLPYMLLAVLVALAGAYVITQLIVDSVSDRFVKQLLESGRLVADRVVAIEQENLDVLRTLARTEGLASAVELGDMETLDRLAYPIAVNTQAEVIDILDRTGQPLYALHHLPGGGLADYDRTVIPYDWSDVSFVTQVLQEQIDTQGDKYAGLVDAPWGMVLYAAGPIFQGDRIVGVVLVGRWLNGLPEDLRQASAANQVTLYAADGTPLATFPEADLAELRLPDEEAAKALASQDSQTRPRQVTLRGRTYSQVLGPLEVRGGTDLGLFGAALSETFLVQARPITQVQMILLVGAVILATVLIGAVVAQQISRPILQVARASQRVAAGDLDQRVQVRTRDEVEDLAQAFNKMLEDLEHAQRVRDIFGRAVSPEVSQVLIEAMQKGDVSLTGESREVTTLFTDIRGFTTFSESQPPEEVLGMLNEVLGAFIDVIEKHEGVVNKFGGDSLLAIFGAPMAQPDHARRAVAAAMEIADRLEGVNAQRQARGLPTVEAGVGVNTGEVVAGLTGSAERLEYTVIGDPVNVTARLQGLSRQFEERQVFVTAATVAALGPEHGLALEDLGEMPLRGKAATVRVYAVQGPGRH